jgi:sugar lactone lactonase YvrE
MSDSTYVVAPTMAVLLLTSCGGSALFSSPSAAHQNQSRTIKPGTRSCLYVFDIRGRNLTVWAQGHGDNNWAQIREISGSRLNRPQDVAEDGHGNLYVTNNSYSPSVTVYAAGATGRVKPIREIQGSATGLFYPGDIAFDQLNNEFYVANRNNRITIYPALANGNVPPISVIRGRKTGLDGLNGLTLDSSGNIYVSNLGTETHLPSITVYAAGSTGDVTPTRTITGSLTKLANPAELALDSSRNVYATNDVRLTMYAAGANGNVKPIRRIHGHLAMLKGPEGIAVDSSDNIYEASYRSYPIKVYAAGSNGDVAPIYRIPAYSHHHGIRILPCK